MKNCILAVIGRDTFYKTWFSDTMNYDVILIVYNDLQVPLHIKEKCKSIYYRQGYKWHLIKKVLQSTGLEYDYYWFPDDDITINAGDINVMFGLMKSEDITLAQPCMIIDENKHALGYILDKQGDGIRTVPFVEVMEPCFEKSFLQQCIPFLDENCSAWGVDVVWSKLCSEQKKKIVAFDNINSKHNSKQEDTANDAYNKLIKDRIDYKKEFQDILKKYNAKKYFEEAVLSQKKTMIDERSEKKQQSYWNNWLRRLGNLFCVKGNAVFII